jgi:prepilin-type N-terminal cleavage/methylation domain-containing protein
VLARRNKLLDVLSSVFRKGVLRHKGFTIIETIFSVAISGILTASIVTTVAGHAQAIQAENVTIGDRASLHVDLSTDSELTDLTTQDLSISDSSEFQKQMEITTAQTELKIVQTAMDIMMINSETRTIVSTPKTNDMSNFPAGSSLYPEYLRERYSKYTYKCNSRGEVVQYEMGALQIDN